MGRHISHGGGLLDGADEGHFFRGRCSLLMCGAAHTDEARAVKARTQMQREQTTQDTVPLPASSHDGIDFVHTINLEN